MAAALIRGSSIGAARGRLLQGPLMADRDEGMRRVTVLTPAFEDLPNMVSHRDIAPAAPSPEMDGCDHCERLETLVEEVMNVVRLGAYRSDESEGVLFDATVGEVRCLFIELKPTRVISLSPREQQIARMVASGRTNQAIASCLEISVWTVSTHLRRIFAKLAVSSRAEMVAHLLADPDIAHVLDRGYVRSDSTERRLP
jgi:DNA-binding CsgD family transcriptional regulator